MKSTRLLLWAVLLLSSFVQAQSSDEIQLKSGTIRPIPNLEQALLDSFNQQSVPGQRQLLILQFHTLPGERQRILLQAAGIELLEYLPSLAYTATVARPLQKTVLADAGVRAVLSLQPEWKMDPLLLRNPVPSWAVKAPGTVEVWISFPKTVPVTTVIDGLKDRNITVTSLERQAYRILALRVAANRLRELAALPFVEYVQPAPPADQPLNYNSRYGSRANLLGAAVADGGKGLRGEGVVVGVGDNSDLQTHVDFARRLIDRAPASASGHGQHVAGTVGGGGIINELYMGYAPKVTMVSQLFSGIILNAPTYVQDHGMVITNNSYGDIIDCDYHGTYDLVSRYMDQMAFDLPYLSNVFAAGNSGNATCSPFATGYHTVLGGYQSAKNLITVGATTDSGLLGGFSSRGPVRDGRVKPEIVAMGQFVASTWPNNIYSYNNGTSMAAPAVSGGLALLYQRYRQLNGGANPKNGLMKALLCNGATDRGSTGPDYQYGYGWMNLLRSVEMLEGSHYFVSGTSNGSGVNHTITVPANTAQLKVLLYWNDPAASVLSAKSLVNDLDLQVTGPGGTALPRILDSAMANLGNAATTGADHSNNIEQVLIDNPAAGTYTLRVNGTAIAQGPAQEYFLVYDAVPVGLRITSPAGAEGLTPAAAGGPTVKISWDVAGLSGTSTLEFSPDNGNTWSVIASGINVQRSLYSWEVPNVTTSTARVRITRDGTGESSTSQPFTIIGQPVVSLDPVQCEGYVSISWTAVPGVTDYEVMQLLGDEMRTIATTTGTSYVLGGLSKDTSCWMTVRARINGKGGKRAVAVSRLPDGGTCAGSISDNDLKLDAIIAPVSGRKFTSTELGAAAVVTVRVKNLDDAPIAGFDLKYRVNNGSWVSESVPGSISAGATYNHSFATTADLSATGNYTVTAVVTYGADGQRANDTAVVVVKQIANDPLNLATAFKDDFETAANVEYHKDTIGLGGIERYDFSLSSGLGRLRSFINTGIAYSGSKALTLDMVLYNASGTTNFLYGTYNLGNYNTTLHDLRLDFQYLNHNNGNEPGNKVWIRGSDQQPWVEAFDLAANAGSPGTYKRSSSIEISDILAAAGQSLTPSFGVRWGQFGKLMATDRENGAGYTFDDVRLYIAQNDLQLRALEAPVANGCGLGAATAITVAVYNSANAALTAVPVRYRINGGSWVSGTVASIAANTTASYTFGTPADFSAPGVYTVQLLVDFPSDNFRDNDTLTTTVRNMPLITSFPYLENFESGDGMWYSGGKRSSWEYGTPICTNINRAASGAKAWKTRLLGTYNDNEHSYLYSPCFDLTGMTAPTLSFSLALDIEDCGNTICDAAWMEYSADGITWSKLGTAASGTNWYSKPGDELWSVQSYTRWHVATVPLPTGLNRFRFRFVMKSDEGLTREGIAIDDIHVYDNTQGIYTGSTLASPLVSAVSGNSWVHFTQGGKLVASIQPRGQNLGTTAVNAYLYNGAVRYTSSQYYHSRNLTVKPANRVLADSVRLRFYFPDSETDSLIAATGCASCARPRSAYELGVSKYTDADTSFENGTVLDNLQGVWTYIPFTQLSLVPFDKGYYAEFSVKDFSEFWLNNGGFDHIAALPVKLMEFTATRSVNDALLKWVVGSETSVLRYEVEVARGDAAMQAGQYQLIGTVAGLGNTAATRIYTFADAEPGKTGTRYYRLKIINSDGSFSYSPLRPLSFDEPGGWQVYPNPSDGRFFLVYQLPAGETLEASVVDAKGRLVKRLTATASGQQQKLSVNIASQNFAPGVYLLQLKGGSRRETFKLNKL